jgi:nitroreductase
MDIIQAIRERRSINNFEPGVEISDGKLKELIELANLSPSSFNLQPWRVVIVHDPRRKTLLRKCAFDQPKVEDASAVLIMVADPEAVEENRERVIDRAEELGYLKPEMREGVIVMMQGLYGEVDSLKRKLFAVKNTSLFAMSLMLAARGLGLETHPMDGFDEAMVKKEFNIPDDKIIPMLIAVGSLKEGTTLLPRAFRREVGEFISFEAY